MGGEVLKKEAFEAIDAIRSYYPKAVLRDGVFVLSESESELFGIAPAWATELKTDMIIAVELHLPTIPFLEQDRRTDRLLEKVHRKLANPRGFDVQAMPSPNGGIDVWLVTALREPMSKEEFRSFSAEIHMVGIAVFQFLAKS